MNNTPASLRLQDVLNELNLSGSKSRPFSIEFVTYNKEKDSGGDIIKLDNAERCGLNKSFTSRHIVGVNAIGNSHHPYAVHTNLITKFNNIPVI